MIIDLIACNIVIGPDVGLCICSTLIERHFRLTLVDGCGSGSRGVYHTVTSKANMSAEYRMSWSAYAECVAVTCQDP